MKQWLFGIAGLLGISTDLGSLLRGFRGFSLFQYMPHFNPTGRSTKTKRTIHIRAPKDHVLDSLWLTGYTRIPSFLECEGCRLSFGCSHVLCVHFDELVVHLSSSVQACDLCHRLSGLSWPEQRNYRGVYIYIYILGLSELTCRAVSKQANHYSRERPLLPNHHPLLLVTYIMEFKKDLLNS